MEKHLELWVIEDLMRRWHCGRRTVASKTRRYARPRLKFVRLANKLFFRPEDVVAYEQLHLMNASKNESAS
jgi:hypothetical protein